MFGFLLAAGSDLLTYILAAAACAVVISVRNGGDPTIVSRHDWIFTISTE